MITDLKEKILLRKYDAGCRRSAYELYKLYKNENLDHFGIIYLKEFLIAYSPHEAIKIISAVDNIKYSNIEAESEYIGLLSFASAYSFDTKSYNAGILLAKKVLDMFHYFHPFAGEFKRKRVADEIQYYDRVVEMFDHFKEYFDEEVYDDGIIFDWEERLFKPTNIANDNASIFSL